MSNTKHTPTPWIAEGQQIVAKENGYRVAIVSSPHPRARGKERMEDLEYCRGNTALIVRACNSHEQLVALTRRAQEILAAYLPPDGRSAQETLTDLLGLFDGPESRAALAAAEA